MTRRLRRSGRRLSRSARSRLLISRLSSSLVVYVYDIVMGASADMQHGPMMDLAFDKEFAKLVEEVCQILA